MASIKVEMNCYVHFCSIEIAKVYRGQFTSLMENYGIHPLFEIEEFCSKI